MRKLALLFRRLITADDGANMIEYIMVLSLIALVAAAGFTVLGTSVNAKADAYGGQIEALGF